MSSEHPEWEDNLQTSELLPMDESDGDDDDSDLVLSNYFGDLDTIGVEEIRLILKYFAKGYKVPDIIKDVLYKVAKIEVEDKEKYVIYKRDPNIERRRISAAKVKVVDGNAVQVNNIVVFGFGADFDGDTVIGDVDIKVVNKNTGIECIIHMPMEDIQYTEFFIFDTSYLKNNCLIKKYKPSKNYDIYVQSINSETGKVSWENITEYSIHCGLNMFKIRDKYGRFDDFWSSSDHSLIVYDEDKNQIIRATPNELIINPKGKFLLKQV